MKIVDLLSLFFLMVVSGGWIAVCAVFAPAYKQMSPATYIEAEKLNSARACKHFAPSLIIAALAVIASIVARNGDYMGSNILSGASAVLLIAAGIFVKAKVLKINHEIDMWDPANPPANWQAVRIKWVHYHSIRTILGVLAFALQGIAVMWSI
jgi:hypothetical protein